MREQARVLSVFEFVQPSPSRCRSAASIINSAMKTNKTAARKSLRTSSFLIFLASATHLVDAQFDLRIRLLKRQAGAGSLSRPSHRCDDSILGEVLNDELWGWAKDELESSGLPEPELGDLESD